MKKQLTGFLLFIFSANCFSAGKITDIVFSGPDDSPHQNIVQIQIEGGFNRSGCNRTFAAIRNTTDRQHLISFALMAFTSKIPVDVRLGSDKYLSDRCTITRLTFEN